MAARAQIALAQLNVFALDQLHQLLDRAVDEPGVGHSGIANRSRSLVSIAPLRHPMPASDLLVAVGLTCPPYAPDLLPPSGREWVALGVVAFVLDPALAEREFVLRID